jgi:23S rRNA (uracil1939-C5)-methyltransferase
MSPVPPVLELSIDALAAGGDGVGRGPDGRVVFVPFAAPGDRLRVRLTEERARFLRGEIEAVLEPGADRVTPACTVFGRCGGCAWQHVAYAAQVDAKRAILGDALTRIARVGAPPRIEFTASPSAYGYRGRARLLVARGQVGFRQRRAHAVCAVTSCPLLWPALDRALGTLAAAPPAGDGEWELAAGSDGRVRVAPLDAAIRRRPAAREAEPERIELVAAGERIRVSPGVFAQGHALLLDTLAAALLEAAGTGDTALELHAGAGFFTLGLARRFARVVAIESDPDAIRDLAGNVAAAGLRQVRVIEARVEAWLAAGEADALGADVVVLDPPRGGIGAPAAAALARSPARRLVYLSCDPATWARDLAVLLSHGWRLTRVHGFDLFPQTPHVEALAVLELAARA